MRLIPVGAALEIAALAVLLISEHLGLPLTFALFTHLGAVYFFTKGFDRRLLEIHLRRELCFFFALIFPLAGMVGIFFYIVVLNRLPPHLSLSERTAPQPAGSLPEEESVFIEDDDFSSLSTAFVRRVNASHAYREIWHKTEETPPVGYFREKEFWRLERDLVEAIRKQEEALALHADDKESPQAGNTERTTADQSRKNGIKEEVGPEEKRRLADVLVHYASFFHNDPRLRGCSLDRAKELLMEAGGGSEEKDDLERFIEIAFLDHRDRECAALCEQLRRLDAWNTGALLRLGESLFRLRDYRKLGRLAREIVGNQAVPAALREIAQMWCHYG